MGSDERVGRTMKKYLHDDGMIWRVREHLDDQISLLGLDPNSRPASEMRFMVLNALGDESSPHFELSIDSDGVLLLDCHDSPDIPGHHFTFSVSSDGFNRWLFYDDEAKDVTVRVSNPSVFELRWWFDWVNPWRRKWDKKRMKPASQIYRESMEYLTWCLEEDSKNGNDDGDLPPTDLAYETMEGLIRDAMGDDECSHFGFSCLGSGDIHMYCGEDDSFSLRVYGDGSNYIYYSMGSESTPRGNKRFSNCVYGVVENITADELRHWFKWVEGR